MIEKPNFSPESEDVVEYLNPDEILVPEQPKELEQGEEALRKIGKLPEDYSLTKQQKMLFYALEADNPIEVVNIGKGALLTADGLVLNNKFYPYKAQYKRKIHEEIVSEIFKRTRDQEHIERELEEINSEYEECIINPMKEAILERINEEYKEEQSQSLERQRELETIGRHQYRKDNKDLNLERLSGAITERNNSHYLDANFQDVLMLDNWMYISEDMAKKEKEIKELEKTDAKVLKARAIRSETLKVEMLQKSIKDDTSAEATIKRIVGADLLKNDLQQKKVDDLSSKKNEKKQNEKLAKEQKKLEEIKKELSADGARLSRTRKRIEDEKGELDSAKNRLERIKSTKPKSVKEELIQDAKNKLKELERKWDEEHTKEIGETIAYKIPVLHTVPDIEDLYYRVDQLDEDKVTRSYVKDEKIVGFTYHNGAFFNRREIEGEKASRRGLKDEKARKELEAEKMAHEYFRDLRKKIGEEIYGDPEVEIEELYFFPTGFLLWRKDGYIVAKNGSPLEKRILDLFDTDAEREAWCKYWQKKTPNNDTIARQVIFKTIEEETKDFHTSYDDKIKQMGKRFGVNLPLFMEPNGELSPSLQKEDLEILERILPKIAPFINGISTKLPKTSPTLKSTRLSIIDFLNGTNRRGNTTLCNDRGEIYINAFKELIVNTEKEANLSEKTDRIMARLTSSVAASLYSNLTKEQAVDFDILVGEKGNVSQNQFYNVYQTHVNDPKIRRDLVKRVYFLKWFNAYMNGTATGDVKEFFDNVKKPEMIGAN